MPKCKYCGQDAGFFHWQHAECNQKHEDGKRQIALAVTTAAADATPLEELDKKLDGIADQSYISQDEERSLVVQAWTGAVDQSLDHGLMDLPHEERLIGIKNQLKLTQAEADGAGALSRVVKAGVLREVMHGTIPQRIKIDGALSINLQKDERLVWVFQRCDYLEDKTRRQYVGGSQGISFRIAKGVYYRVGAFKGQAIDRTERVHVDTGLVAATNKNIYFVGQAKSLRIPYTKVVSFQPFSDGIGLIRDAASAKPQIFVTHDGWFTYNLVTNLAKL
jgi:hypothetical protein